MSDLFSVSECPKHLRVVSNDGREPAIQEVQEDTGGQRSL